LLRLLDRLEETLIGTLLAGAVLVVLASVVQRYGLSHTVALMHWAEAQGYTGLAGAAESLVRAIVSVRLTWAQELTIFMLVWMAKIGAAYGVRTGIHVGVDVLVNRLEGAWRHGLILVGLLAGALFTGIVAVLGARFVHHLYGTGHYAAVLEVPMWAVYLAVPVGSSLMCFRFLEAAWKLHTQGSDPTHRPFGPISGVTGEGLDPGPRDPNGGAP
jgi:TRAP-type C4-dicarboxylate transport system permease small subunit